MSPSCTQMLHCASLTAAKRSHSPIRPNHRSIPETPYREGTVYVLFDPIHFIAEWLPWWANRGLTSAAFLMCLHPVESSVRRWHRPRQREHSARLASDPLLIAGNAVLH